MKKHQLIYLLPLILASCTSITSSPKEDKHKMEMALHKVRTDIEDVKHDLNTYQIEHHIIEGKIIDLENSITSLTDNKVESQRSQLQQLAQDFAQIGKKISQLTKKQENLIADIRQLTVHANDTTTALQQYKDKISEFEKNILLQNEHISELNKIKKSLTKISSKKDLKKYVVKQGDTLKELAINFKSSVDEIQTLNDLDDDLIKIGQEIMVPIIDAE